MAGQAYKNCVIRYSTLPYKSGWMASAVILKVQGDGILGVIHSSSRGALQYKRTRKLPQSKLLKPISISRFSVTVFSSFTANSIQHFCKRQQLKMFQVGLREEQPTRSIRASVSDASALAL
jgi:hypothetical protein